MGSQLLIIFNESVFSSVLFLLDMDIFLHVARKVWSSRTKDSEFQA